MLGQRNSLPPQSRPALAAGEPVAPRPVLSATARLWRRVKTAARRAAVPAAAAALVFPSLMTPKAAYADGVETVQPDGVIQLGDMNEFGGTAALSRDGGHYLLFQKWINEGVGYQEGFSSIGLHSTLKDWGGTHLFADNRVLITDHSRIGYNGLLGVRTLRGDGLLGAWIGYDSTESNNGFRYQQISFGGEALFPAFDLRANAYLPTDSDPNFVGFTGLGTAAPAFSGNSLLFTDPALFEESVGGWEVEAGTQILPSTRGYVGVYGLYPDLQGSAIGVQGRAEVRVSEELNVQFIGSNDDIYGGTFQVVAELQFSGRAGADILPCWDCDYRRHGQVRRRWPVATLATRGFATRAAQSNFEDLNFVFVDNQAAAGGDGTFENPFQSLPGVADGADFIIVDAGVGETLGTIALQRGQSLLGEGKPIRVRTDRGVFNAPGLDSTGRRPTLVGDGTGPVVTLASDTTLRSLNILAGDMATAIAGTGLDNFVIDCVTASGDRGAVLAGVGGRGVITDSRFNASGRDGLFVATGSRGLTLDMSDVAIAGTGGGVNNGLFLRSGPGGSLNADINRLSVDNAAVAGIRVDSDRAVANVEARNVRIDGSGDGVLLNAEDGTVSADLTNLVASGGGDGVRLEADGGVGRLSVENAVLNGFGGDGVAADVTDSAATVALEGVSVSGVGGDAVRVAAADGSFAEVDLSGVNANNAGGTGVILAAEGDSRITADVADLTALNAGLDGVLLTSGEDSTLEARIAGATLDRASRDGLGALADGGVLRLDADTVSVDRAGFDGVDVAAVDGGTLLGSVNGLNANGVGDDAVAVGAAGGNVRLDLSNVVALGAGDNGLDATAGMPGRPGDVRLTATNADFSGSRNTNVRLTAEGEGSRVRLDAEGLLANNSVGGSGILVSGVDGACAILEGTGVEANGNATDNLQIRALGDNADVRVLLADAQLNDAGRDGIDVLGEEGLIRLGLDGAEVIGSAANGIDVEADEGTMARIELADAVITQSGLDGIEYDADGGSRVVIQGDNVDLSGNGGFGVDGRSDNGSVASVQLRDSDLGMNPLGGARIDTGTQGGAARSTFTLTDGVLSNTGGSGLLANTENGSRGDFVLTRVDASGNAESGVDANYRTGTGSVILEDVNADGNGATGVGVLADDASDVLVRADGLQASGNGDDGVSLVARNASEVMGRLTDVTADGNGRDGFRMLSTDPDSLLDFVLRDVSGDGNMRSGLMVDATAGGSATVCAFDGSFSGNLTDGVNVLATDPGSLADVAFTDVSADNNLDNGFEFVVNDAATLVAELTATDGDPENGVAAGAVSASGNANEGLLFTSADAEGAYLLMDGDDLTFDGNSAAGGNGATVRVVRAQETGVRFAGSVTNSGDDGLNVRIIDTVLAALEIGAEGRMVDDGTGTDTLVEAPYDFTGNGGNGIDAVVRSTMPGMQTNMDIVTVPVGKNQNATFRSYNVANNNASGNGDQGIELVLDNVFIAAGTLPSVVGNTASDNLMGDGVSVLVRDSNLPGLFSISENTADNNPEFGVDVAIIDSTVGALRVDDNSTTGNGTGGVRVFIDPSQVGSVSMSGNDASSNLGDGLTMIVDESMVGTLDIRENLSSLNEGLGLRLDVRNGSLVNELSVGGNFGGDVNETGVLFNVLSQSSFTLENSSVLESELQSFVIDISQADNGPLVWDTIEPGASSPFRPFGLDDVVTGLFAVNGQQVVAGTRPLEDPQGNDLPGGGLPDNQSILALQFNDFQPMEVFGFSADTDEQMDMQEATVPSIVDFVGSPAVATFSDGTVLQGFLAQTVGGVGIALTADETQDLGFIRNTAGGVRAAFSDSVVGEFLFEDNRVQANGGDGLEIVLDNADVFQTTLRDNAIVVNAGDGVRLLDPDTQGAAINFDLVDNRLTNNAGTGVNVRLTGAEALESTMVGNRIDLHGGVGVRVDVRDDSFADVRFGDTEGGRNVVDGNTDAGLGMTLQDNASGQLVVENSEFTNTADGTLGAFDGDGVRVIAQDNARLDDLRFGDATAPGQISFVASDNESTGLALEVRDNAIVDDGRAGNNGLKVAQATITGNGYLETNGVPDDGTADVKAGLLVVRSGNAFLENVNVSDADISENGLSTGTLAAASGNNVAFQFSGGSADITGNPAPLRINVDIRDTTIRDAGVDADSPGIGANVDADGLAMILSGGVNASLNLTRVAVSGSDGQGVDIDMVGTTDLIARVMDSSISGLNADGDQAFFSDSGLTLTAGENAVADVLIENTVVSDTGGEGFDSAFRAGLEFDASDQAAVTVNVVNTSVTNAGGDGLRFRSDDGATLRGVLTDVTSSGNSGNGLDGEATGTGLLFLTGERLTTADNGGDALLGLGGGAGVSLESNLNGVLVADLTDTLSLRNAGEGLYQRALFDSSNTVTLFGTNNPSPAGGSNANSSFSFNGLTGVFARNAFGGNSEADLILQIQDTAIVGNGDDGTTPPEQAGLYFDGNDSGGGVSILNEMGNLIQGNAGQDVLVE